MSARKRKPRPYTFAESLPFGVLLAAIGGFLDAYTYITRGGVFANAQTGNIVLLGIRFAQGDFWAMLQYVYPILAFSAGVVAAAQIKRMAGAGRKVQWVHIILALEAAILFGIGFLPSTVPHAIVNVVISFVASVQVSSFQSLMGSPFATTMTTGNLRSAVQAYYQAVTRKNKPALQKALCYTWIIVSFCGGAMIGVWTSYFFGTYSLFLCVAILTASLIWSVVDKKVCGESAEDEEKSE